MFGNLNVSQTIAPSVTALQQLFCLCEQKLKLLVTNSCACAQDVEVTKSVVKL